MIASLGVTDIRLTTEWARIEPTAGKTDSEALDRYRDMLAHAVEVGLRPWVTLVSTSLPGWFSDDGGSFADDHGFAPMPEELGVLLQRIAERTGDRPLVISGNGVATTRLRRDLARLPRRPVSSRVRALYLE